MKDERPLDVTRLGAVGVLELARPEKYNALSGELLTELGAALRRFESDKSVRALLVRARGKHFSTGADLDEVGDARQAPEGRRTGRTSGGG
jgi:enoyl-CoA hydratase